MVYNVVVLFQFTWYLQAPLFDLHAFYRLLYSIYIVLTGSFIRFTWKFTGSFIRLTWYLQAPLFDLHGFYRLLYSIYRLLYSIYMVFTGSFIRFTGKFTDSFIRFTWYLQAPLFDLHENLQAPLFDLHDIYRLLHSICMKFTGSLKPFTCYLQVTFSRFTCYLHGLCPLVWEFTGSSSNLHVSLKIFTCFLQEYLKTCKWVKSMEITIYSIFLTIYMLFTCFLHTM